MTIHSVPQLFALANGLDCTGPHSCFYCAAPCGENNPSSQYVKDTFTDYTGVACSGSKWVCDGCVLCLDERASLTLVDGEKRDGQKRRNYSWLITPDGVIAANKSHIAAIRGWCVDGYDFPPWAAVLAESGQKQLLYRGVVNLGKQEPWTVTLEAERITYYRDELIGRLRFVGKMVAALGKPALADPLEQRHWCALWDYHGADAEQIIETWERIAGEPLSRLALFLSANKEDCQREHSSIVAATDQAHERRGLSQGTFVGM